SGSGKTTLLTLIGGLRTVQEGSLQVLGQELFGLSNAELVAVRRRIGFIFQAHNLFASLTAYQNVRMALELYSYDPRQRDARIVELLTTLGLGHRIHYKPHQLSGGQRQRVAIARALANRPKLILADEPTAALDKDSGRQVVDLLKNLARHEGCTSLIVTHDSRILDVADRIVNMVDGQIVSNMLVEESVALCRFLRDCPVFTELPLSTLSRLAAQMVKEYHPPGAVIIRQGDEGDKFYVVRRGHVRVVVSDGDTSREVGRLGEGQFFGEVALMSGARRNATVEALDEVETFALGKEDFQAVLASSAEFKEEMRKVLFQRQ
ncbi:MAG: ATP-binding cassette domain-containing protein, partial [Gemmataceae bacterium]|nr:ATP-binding cassette domain-containing protein [Gemmataceae bacterium]MDW8265977.1 ATP-binding cassette domain-containing protein [Gemmataceae bacterium]